MSLPFDTTTLPELTEEETKILMATIIQNGLMIQQLQLMVALKQKEEKQREEERRERERDEKVEKEKQNKLKEEEIRTMETWSKEESRQYVERFRGYCHEPTRPHRRAVQYVLGGRGHPEDCRSSR